MRGKKGILKVLLIMILSALFCAATLAVVPAGEVKTSCGAKGWYFAEGYTGGDFDTWILIQNPNKENTTAHLRFFTPNGEPITQDVLLKGETRFSILLNTVPGLEKQEVAAEVICDGEGVVAERAMYFNYNGKAGGHATIGASSTSGSWYMPEGYTGGDFDTYVLLMNPNKEDANNVQVKLMRPKDGKYYMFKTSVPAGRRRTIKLDDLVWTEGQDNVIPAAAVQTATGGGGGEQPKEQVKFDNTEVSTAVYSDKPLVAERSIYFDYFGKAGGSNSIAAPCTGEQWFLPEGYTGGQFDTWVFAMNPSGDTVDITYTFYTNAPGVEPKPVTHTGVPPWSRDTINVNVEGLQGTDVSTKVTATRSVESANSGSAACIVAERSVYFKYGASAEGATSIGSYSTYPKWFLAEGYTGGGFDTYVLVMNPYDFPQKVTASFMTPDGSVIKQEYAVPARYRLTIKVDDVKVDGVPVLANTEVSTQIEAEPISSAGFNASCEGSGVVAERAMYFTYIDPIDGSKKTGGSCSIGYGSW